MRWLNLAIGLFFVGFLPVCVIGALVALFRGVAAQAGSKRYKATRPEDVRNIYGR